jgi:2-oxoglutarate ferredoxin oxidoreductase subunit gamma
MIPSNHHEIRWSGNGGQGVILATIILAEAAIMSGSYTAQTGTYGPEARGGSCKAEVIISNQPIGFTKVIDPTFLLVLSKRAFDRYTPRVSENCLVILDSSLPIPDNVDLSQLIVLPMMETARTVIGKLQTSNVVAIGCVNAFLDIADEAVLKEAVLKHVPVKSRILNIRALEEGYKLARAWRKENGK